MSGQGERIRVARIIGRLNIGGPALHTVLLTEELDPARYATLLIAGQEDPDEGCYLDLVGRNLPSLVRVPTLRRALHPIRDGLAFARIASLLRSFRPHVVHTHTAKAGTLGRLAARAVAAPVVVHTFHGHVLEGYFRPSVARAFVEIERRLARRTDAVLTVSPEVRADLLALGIGNTESVRLMPLGLPLERFSGFKAVGAGLRGELGIGSTVPLVGIVARLVPIKSHVTFLQAAAALARTRKDVHFVIVGDGERRSALEALAGQLGLVSRVHFLGWRADLEQIYAALDVVVLTSRNEGSPVALIEALAAGRAVVATRVGGVPDLVQQGLSGLLVEPNDPTATGLAIGRLLDSPRLRQDLGTAGQRHVLLHHGKDRLVADMDRLYCELLQGKLGAAAPTAALLQPAPARRAAAAGAA